MGRLLGIATRTATRVPMAEPARARISTESGVEGDFRGRPGPRQVTVLAREGFEAACAELGVALPWTIRRANLFVEGVDLVGSVGATLVIGDVRLAITAECDPCRVMDLQHEGLRAALAPAWRGGVSCRVLRSGEVAIGDRTELRRMR